MAPRAAKGHPPALPVALPGTACWTLVLLSPWPLFCVPQVTPCSQVLHPPVCYPPPHLREAGQNPSKAPIAWETSHQGPIPAGRLSLPCPLQSSVLLDSDCPHRLHSQNPHLPQFSTDSTCTAVLSNVSFSPTRV